MKASVQHVYIYVVYNYVDMLDMQSHFFVLERLISCCFFSSQFCVSMSLCVGLFPFVASMCVYVCVCVSHQSSVQHFHNHAREVNLMFRAIFKACKLLQIVDINVCVWVCICFNVSVCLSVYVCGSSGACVCMCQSV